MEQGRRAASAREVENPWKQGAATQPSAAGSDDWDGGGARSEGSAHGNGVAGKFDYYLLTLSWAPEYCYNHGNSPECDGSHRGFVVHGLWPQNNDGTWPESCSSEPLPASAQQMLDIMPDQRLIAHEWEKHGTCSGLSGDQFFATVRRAFTSVRVPPQLQNPSGNERVSADQIKQAFLRANPGMAPEDMAVTCRNRYFSGVELCRGKDLKPTACRAVRNCTQDSITVSALR